MSQTLVISILRDAFYTVIIAAAPMLVVAVVVGLVISILQATTQIHEQTLAFVPKIVGVFFALILFGGLIMNTLIDFTVRLFSSVNSIIG